MKHSEKYRDAVDRDKLLFNGIKTQVDNKVCEYRILTVRSAFSVAGAGSIAVPAVVGLADKGPVATSAAAMAYVMSAICTVVAYLIHINWILHAGHWEASL